MSETENRLKCTMCFEVKETYSDIVYSQGDRVCTDCKKLTRVADNKAFDRDITMKGGDHESE